MKKLCLSLLTCLMMIVLSSCSLPSINPLYRAHVREIERLTDKVDKEVDKAVKTLIECINSKNRDDLKKLFSKEVQELSDFDDTINKLIEYFDGEILDSEMITMPSTGSETAPGRSSYHSDSFYKFITSNDNYLITFEIYPFNTIEPKREGIVWMYVIHSKDFDKAKNFDREIYWGDGKQTPGIHFDVIPEPIYKPNTDIKCEETAKNFVDACNGKDRGAIIQMFAENVRKRVDLNESITRLFEYVGGQITDYSPELDNGQSRALVDEDKTEFVGCVVYKLDTAEGTYHLYIAVRTADSEDHGEEGIYSIHIVKDDDVQETDPHSEYLADNNPEGIIIG